MPTLAVQMTRYIDRSFPGWVECVFYDAQGQQHTVHEKVPVIATPNKDLKDSDFPMEGELACKIETEWRDEAFGNLAKINTERPYGIESIEGSAIFTVRSSQLRR